MGYKNALGFRATEQSVERTGRACARRARRGTTRPAPPRATERARAEPGPDQPGLSGARARPSGRPSGRPSARVGAQAPERVPSRATALAPSDRAGAAVAARRPPGSCCAARRAVRAALPDRPPPRPVCGAPGASAARLPLPAVQPATAPRYCSKAAAAAALARPPPATTLSTTPSPAAAALLPRQALPLQDGHDKRGPPRGWLLVCLAACSSAGAEACVKNRERRPPQRPAWPARRGAAAARAGPSRRAPHCRGGRAGERAVW